MLTDPEGSHKGLCQVGIPLVANQGQDLSQGNNLFSSHVTESRAHRPHANTINADSRLKKRKRCVTETNKRNAKNKAANRKQCVRINYNTGKGGTRNEGIILRSPTGPMPRERAAGGQPAPPSGYPKENPKGMHSQLPGGASVLIRQGDPAGCSDRRAVRPQNGGGKSDGALKEKRKRKRTSKTKKKPRGTTNKKAKRIIINAARKAGRARVKRIRRRAREGLRFPPTPPAGA